MTKQEEIREGITNQQRLRGAFADKILTRHKMTRDEALWEALAYMRFLHSQDVVIKTDRELPKAGVRGLSKEQAEMKNDIWITACEHMILSSCGFFESLIGE